MTFRNEDEFWDAVYDVAEVDEELKKRNKEVSKLKNDIKNYMIENDMDVAELEDLEMKFSLSVAVSNGFKEQELIEFLEELAIEEEDLEIQENILNAIKEVKQLDSNVLEDLLFKGLLTNEQLKPFVTERVTNRLLIGKL